jgi:lipoprotein-anchoring transpeptidase ErfK/SrfK
MFRAVTLATLLSGGAALAAPPKVAVPVTPPVTAAAAPAPPVKPATPAVAATIPTATAAATIVIPAKITAPQRALIRLEILLDRAHFSPGVIDGKGGANLKLAMAGYAAANGLPTDATPAAVTDKLVATDAEMTVARYTLTAADVAGPFVEKLPTDMAELAKLDSPAFSGPVEEIAERFHMDEDLLKALNPGADFTHAGTELTVAAVGKTKLGGAATKIEVDKTAQAVKAFGADGKLLAVYPATVGSLERPAPDGSYKVRTVATKATYTYDPKRLTFGDPGKGKLTIKAGPNNPVGTTWIALTKPTYGIHGSPDPRLIGKRASHGCVRLTNWDIEQLASAVKAGAEVVFTGAEVRAKT